MNCLYYVNSSSIKFIRNMKSKVLCLGLFIIFSLTCFGQKQVNLKTLCLEMINNASVAEWPSPYYTEMQASSYDRKSISPELPGWFANDDRSQYIRTEDVNDRLEHVMMVVDGPGAVVRFWLTTFRRNGILRIYLDGKPDPALIIPAYDLMQSGLKLGKALLEPHSSYEAKEKGGSTLYLPIPYANHCKITFEDKDPDNQPRYYQINYRTYKKGTSVKTFKTSDLKALKNTISFVNYKLLHPDSIVKDAQTVINKTILPNTESAMSLPTGNSAIRYLIIKLQKYTNENYEQALRSTILKIEFDGKQTVWCPLGDFFGSGVGSHPLKSWYRSVGKDGTLTCNWVIPYRNFAKITIINKGIANVIIAVKAITAKYRWDKNTMYFHADWRSENNVAIKQSEADRPTDWNFNSIVGKGVFIGDTFAVYNHMHKWYGEGDQKIWVDNASFPDEYGTGTEDYYNTSWAPVVLYQTPFANAPRADNPDSYGYNTFTRTRNLDAVPFKKSFRYSLETLGWENGFADFAATTYWYGFQNAKSYAATEQSIPSVLPR